MGTGPVPGDVDTAADPHLVVRLHVVKKALQGAKAAWPSQQPAMHADGQHLGSVQSLGITLLVQHVEAVLQVLEELLAGVLGGSPEAYDIALYSHIKNLRTKLAALEKLKEELRSKQERVADLNKQVTS